jgi:proliferating cell nuclear antigen
MSDAALADGVVFEAIIDSATIQQYVDTVASLVDECKLHIGDHGLRVSAIDPGNVAMWLDTTLAPRAFEAFESPGQATVGVNLQRLDDLLDGANADDLVNLRLNMETRYLHIEYRTISHTMALIDPDSIRSEPDDPGLDLPNMVVLEGRQLAEAVDAAELVSDHLELSGHPDAREVRVTASGDTDETIVTYGDDEVIDARVDEAAESLFSIPYLEDIAGPIPADAEVVVTFGDDFPVTLSFEGCEGALDAEAMVAPRIQN